MVCPDIKYPLVGGRDLAWTAHGTVQRTTGVLLEPDDVGGNVEFAADGTSITSARSLNKPEFHSGLYTAPAPTARLGGTTTVLLRAANHPAAASTFALWDGEVNASMLAGLQHRLQLAAAEQQDQYERMVPGFVYYPKNNSAWDPLANDTLADDPTYIAPTQMPAEEVQANVNNVPVWRAEDHAGEVSQDAGDGFNAIGFHVLPAATDNTDPTVRGRVVLWCRFQDRGRPMKMEVAGLEHDPTDGLHRYQLRLSIDETDKQADWDVELLVDGRSVALLLGAPALSAATHMAAHAWDVDAAFGNIPPLEDVFTAPVGIMELRDVALPSEPEEQVCGPGASFYSFGSPIVAFEAAVGREPGMHDEAAFSVFSRPCVPCLRPCDRYMCDPGCAASQAERTVTVNGLALEGYTQPYSDWVSAAAREVNGSTIRPGDVAIIGVDAVGGVVYVATLVDIAAGTVVAVTTDAWDGAAWQGVAGGLEAIASGTAIPAGTVVRLEGVAFPGSNGTQPFVVSLYTGAREAPVFLYAAEHKANATLMPAYGPDLPAALAVAHLRAPHSGYTRGPSIAPHGDMLRALRVAFNWQVAAESFEPFDWLPEGLGVAASPVDEGHSKYEHPGMFYLTVRAISASGASATAASSGVLVDVTPPELVEAYMFRLEDGEQRPVQVRLP